MTSDDVRRKGRERGTIDTFLALRASRALRAPRMLANYAWNRRRWPVTERDTALLWRTYFLNMGSHTLTFLKHRL